LKLARQSIRTVFAALIILGMLWGNSTLLYRCNLFSEQTQLFFVRANFAVAILLVQVFLAFFVQFAEIREVFRGPVFIASAIINVGLAVCSFTDLVIPTLALTQDNVVIGHGPLYPWYLASALGLEGYGLFLMIRTY